MGLCTLMGNHPVFNKPAVTFSINKSDFVTSVSQSLKKDTQKLFNIKNEIEVIPKFIRLNNNTNDPVLLVTVQLMGCRE
jgi:hypothetical protein